NAEPLTLPTTQNRRRCRNQAVNQLTPPWTYPYRLKNPPLKSVRPWLSRRKNENSSCSASHRVHETPNWQASLVFQSSRCRVFGWVRPGKSPNDVIPLVNKSRDPSQSPAFL